jgi:ankyrin repeat protein
MYSLIYTNDKNEIRDTIKKIMSGREIISEKNHFNVFLWACQKGHLEIVKLLIDMPGFNSLNMQDTNGTTPFHNACQFGHIEIVKLLISTPGFNSLNTQCNYGQTAFLHACVRGHLEIVKVLISVPGFNSLNTSNNFRLTPFHYACFYNYLDIVTILLLQDNLIRSDNTILYSTGSKNRIIDVDANRHFYMKKYKTSLIIDLYRLVVFLSDDYLKVKEDNASSKFFKIIKKMPCELKIKIIFAIINYDQTSISSQDFNNGLKNFVINIENL